MFAGDVEDLLRKFGIRNTAREQERAHQRRHDDDAALGGVIAFERALDLIQTRLEHFIAGRTRLAA